MKKTLKLSHKKVSWRSLKKKIQSNVVQQMEYIRVVEALEESGFKLLQIDEFTANRFSFLIRAWVHKGKSGYVTQETHKGSYSVIAAITDTNFELIKISNCNTNGEVFNEFIEELDNILMQKYGDRKTRFIVSADGARYHWIDSVKGTLKKAELIMIQTVPYTPQFSPVEIFINCIKNRIKMRLRQSK